MPARSVAYVFTGNFTNLTAGLAVAGKNVSTLGTKMTALDRDGAKMRSGLTTLGSTAGKVGLVAAAGLTVAIGAAARFDKSMSAVQAATHESAESMEDLRAAAIKAGADTSFSASEAAGAIEQLAKAGVSTADILGGGLTGALDLAAAGSLEVADAAEYAATAMTQFELGGDQVGHVADLLAAGAGKAQGEVSDLGMALKQSGLVAAQTGLSIEETVGTLSAFASAGLLGSDAGTSFKTMLQSLTPTGQKAADEMERLGISAYDAQGNFVGITDFAGQLQEGLRGLSVEQQNAAMKIIFGSDAVRAASVLYQQGATGIQGWIDKTNDSGYAAETAGLMLDNLAGDFEKLKGSLETALIGAGDGSQGPLRSLVQGLDGAVSAFNKLPPAAQSSTTALLGITAVTGGSLWFGAKVVGGVANARQALDDLGITAGRTSGSLGRVARTAGGITAVAGAMTLLGNTVADISGAKLDMSDLSRDLEALANGQDSDILSRITNDLDLLGQTSGKLAEPVHELRTAFGVFGNTGLDNASDNIKAIDQELASWVESGNTEKAAEAFAVIAAAITGMPKESSFNPAFIEGFDSYSTALDNAASSAGEAGAAADGAAGQVGDFGTESRAAAVDTEKLADALRKSKDEAREQASAFITLGDSLNDTKASLSDWIADMREQADALKDFRVNAETAANKGLRGGLIKALQEAGPEGAMRMKQLANATKSEIGRANSSWQAGQREIRAYTNAVGGVPKAAGTNVTVHAEGAFFVLARIRRELASIPKHLRTEYVVNQTNAINKPKTPQADGGFVPKTGLPYADRHPYLLADGEGVTTNRNGETDRFRDVVSGINAGLSRGQIKGMLADGGFAGGRPSVASGFGAGPGRPGSVADAVAAIVELRGSIRALNVDIKESDKAIKRETRERDLAADAADRAQAEVDRLTGLYSSLSSAIQSGLAANQFETVAGVANDNPWASSTASTEDRPATFDEIMGRLTSSTDDAYAMIAATNTLTANGLSGDALQSVLEQGLGTSQMFAGLTPEELAQYQNAFGINSLATQGAGDVGGQAVYGAEMEKANQIAAASQAELARQTAELQTANQQRNVAERQRDRQEKQLDRVKDALGDIRSEIKKARGELESAARSKR